MILFLNLLIQRNTTFSFDDISFWTCCRRCARGFGWGRWVGGWVGWWAASRRARHRQDGSTEGRPVALLGFHLTLNSQDHLYPSFQSRWRPFGHILIWNYPLFKSTTEWLQIYIFENLSLPSKNPIAILAFCKSRNIVPNILTKQPTIHFQLMSSLKPHTFVRVACPKRSYVI